MRFDAFSRSGSVYWEFDSGGASPPPPPPPPPSAARLNFTHPVTGGARAIGYEGFGGSAGAPPPPPAARTITLQVLDAAAGGAALASLSPIQWASYDTATQLSQTWGVAPTDSGTAESTNGAGLLVIELPNTTRTSGQPVYLQLQAGSGASTRTFGAVVTVD